MNTVDAKRFEEYKRILDIDLLRLDKALSQHSISYFDVYDEWTDAEKAATQIEYELEELLAQTEIRIRQELNEKGERVTEKLIASHLTLDKELKKVKIRYFEAKTDASKWKGLYEAFKQRGFLLSKIVDRETEKMKASGGIYTSEDVDTATEIWKRERAQRREVTSNE